MKLPCLRVQSNGKRNDKTNIRDESNAAGGRLSQRLNKTSVHYLWVDSWWMRWHRHNYLWVDSWWVALASSFAADRLRLSVSNLSVVGPSAAGFRKRVCVAKRSAFVHVLLISPGDWVVSKAVWPPGRSRLQRRLIKI